METRYHIIKNKKELKKLIACCKATGYACCDYETNAEPIYNKSFKPTILSVSWMPGFGASIPLDHFETKAYIHQVGIGKDVKEIWGRSN